MTLDAGLRALGARGPIGLCTFLVGPGRAEIVDANDALLAILGYDRESWTQAAPIDWYQLTPAGSRAALDERMAELADVGAHGPREQQIVSRDGTLVPVLVASAMVHAASDTVPVTASSICIDLTDQVRARADAERASQAKSRFLAVMTHELRTPLNTIVGQAELVADGTYGAVTETQVAALGRMRRAGTQLRSLVDEVLTFSRLETGVEQYDVRDVVLADALDAAAPVAEGQAAAKGIAFELVPPDRAMRVRADEEKLRLVLAALLSNAVKFTPAGGRITLDTAVRAAASDYVFVRVTDTGHGIDATRQQAIFEPFTQMDEGRARTATGLGLGLTISRDLARGMGGDLRVRSAGGHAAGSTFTLSLRRAGTAG